ncbi:MAG: VWA domain-containing protein [Sandaracinaceae bacterium]|nr:VWA domain-containing protein [Sandaracinaceae bacterium]
MNFDKLARGGLVPIALLGLALAACDPGSAPPPRRDGGAGGDADVTPTGRDTDGDGILDEWEDASTAVDTDGDGTPDFEDLDSDDDGIPDSVEGNPGSSGMPVDSDSDGTPDFRDLDSDGNGILDAAEPEGDLDGDRTLDFADLDDDGDSLSDIDEIGPDPAAPLDFDMDGIPDYRDDDSDNDTIGDLHESILDTDGDGIYDRFDLDSDGDGWTDAEEAGDADVTTPPVDTDGDRIPDFRDTDSDGDGLSDRRERELGTARDNADTDGDGVSDLVEIAGCPDGDASCAMDATDPTSSPRARGDFVFAEPYMMPPMPPRDTLDFATDIRVADVYFLMDTTGSMGGSIASLRTSLATFIPRVRMEIPDVWIGIGDFKDYPVTSYGGSTDFAYRNLQNVTAVEADAIAALSGYNASGGYDGPESHVPALWAVATGMGLAGTSGTAAPPGCPAGQWGYPCFRSGAVPIVILITDVTMHNGPGGTNAYSDALLGGHAPTFDEAVTALTMNNIRVIGIGQGSGGISDMNAMSTATGAVDGTGAPLTSVWSGGAIGDTVLTQIQILSNTSRFDISVNYVDDPSDTVETFSAFVDHIEANTVGDAARGCDPRMADDTNGDGYPDTFRAVESGTRVCFDIIVKQNDTVMPTTVPQLFMGTLRVLGDGFTELDSRDVFFLVPPEPEDPGGPD